MRILILQHTDQTTAGSTLEWLKNKNAKHEVRALHKGDALPSMEDFDWLVLCGGGMNLDQVDLHPWLAEEKQFVRQAIANGKTVLGLCLGGQMISQCLGGAVKPHEHWEVGWHPVQIGAEDRLTVFQWHQDTFSIPEGATRIASSRSCENQGFIFGSSVVGLQFHPEASEEWIKSCLVSRETYPEGPYVQDAETIAEDLAFLTPMKKWYFKLLDHLESLTRQKIKTQNANAKSASNTATV